MALSGCQALDAALVSAEREGLYEPSGCEAMSHAACCFLPPTAKGAASRVQLQGLHSSDHTVSTFSGDLSMLMELAVKICSDIRQQSAEDACRGSATHCARSAR